MTPPIRKLVVVGGGSAGWMAAAAMKRVFGDLLDVTLVESEAIGTVGVGEATIPDIRLFNTLLGLDEDEFLAATEGSIKLGIEFVDWTRMGHRYLHAFGEVGLPVGGLSFHQYWLRAQEAGDASDLWEHSLNAQAARLDRFDRPERTDTGRMGPLVWAYHFDAGLYAKFLRGWCEARGVRRAEGQVVEVLQGAPDDGVAGVRLDRGELVEGDLFIDCSGFRGLLIEGALKAGYDDWTEWLPADRAVAVPCASVSPLTPYTRSTARESGWQWRIPLQHRTGNGYVYSSRFISDDEAAARLMSSLDGEALAEPRTLRFTTGKRRRMWVKNVVALGLASGFMEPLESTSIHLVQAGLEKLIRLFPNTNMAPGLAETFNREMDAEFEAVRDFLVLHYRATERDDTPFWRHCRDLPQPPGLARKLAVWRANASLPNEAADLFKPPSWLQVLVGQGVMPEGRHALADQVAPDKRDRFLADIRALVDLGVARLPDHGQFLADRRRAAQPQPRVPA
ncbi:tryptophan halogenase family protein [Brevundimonas lutea]|uniref:tryptophan halogenase family protein n=1 Tax=Brevundimonas lutea TaxID=2293980 RepID=UPI000F03C967|nr:tryptophan halogenase family protein [Brevundimonas lutea]